MNVDPRSAVASEGLSLLAHPAASQLISFGGYNGKYHQDVHIFRPGKCDHTFGALDAWMDAHCLQEIRKWLGRNIHTRQYGCCCIGSGSTGSITAVGAAKQALQAVDTVKQPMHSLMTASTPKVAYRVIGVGPSLQDCLHTLAANRTYGSIVCN